jgi:hypothetical protein
MPNPNTVNGPPERTGLGTRAHGRLVPRPLAAWLALAAAFYITFILRARFVVDGVTHFTLFDDAMVSMRYARNLAEGRGLVFNPGDAPVEGFTNPLWTLWMAVLHRTGVSEAKISLLVSLTSALLLLALMGVVWRIARETFADAGERAEIAAAVTGLYYPLAFWSLRGMEVGVLAFAAYAAVLATMRLWREWSARQAWWLALLVFAMPLIRPDGAVPAGLVLLFAALGVERGKRLRTAALVGGALVLSLAGQTAVRLAYFGDALPNTYYLKMTGAPLLERVGRGLGALRDDVQWHLWPLVLFAIVGVRLRERRLALLATIALSQLAYSVYVGGDAWEWFRYANRYIVVGVPALVILSAGGAMDLLSAAFPAMRADARWRPWAARAVIVVLLVALSKRAVPDWLRTGGEHVADDARAATAAIRVRQITRDDAVIAVTWAGTIPYFAHRRTVDLLGKNDRYLARLPERVTFLPGHNKWDYAYSIGRGKPDLILQLWRHYGADDVGLRLAGYDHLWGTVWVRRNTERVDRARVEPALKGLLWGNLSYGEP